MLHMLQTKLYVISTAHKPIDPSEVHNLEHNDTRNQSRSKWTALTK